MSLVTQSRHSPTKAMSLLTSQCESEMIQKWEVQVLVFQENLRLLIHFELACIY
eukprot:m.309578 g.309578  ORF g.309578 m.309578 type:complete len:54 (+) comp46980_c0_seq1:859-1020(+)